MAISDLPADRKPCNEPCKTERDSWQCKNMLPVDGDTSLTHEHYACTVCGRRMSLDYDEMR